MRITPSDALSLLLGALEIAFALILARQLPRLTRAFPWLAALTVFFVLRGADRIYFGLRDREASLLALSLDAVLLVVLVLLLFGVKKMGRALETTQEEARHREEEYARALADYKKLARHRLGNPLAAIRGGVLTLKEMPELEPDLQAELLDTIHEQALRLERIALDPELASEEEKHLRPRPDV